MAAAERRRTVNTLILGHGLTPGAKRSQEAG